MSQPRTICALCECPVIEGETHDLACCLSRVREMMYEARAVAYMAYWNLPVPMMLLPTGKYWHDGAYPWLKERPEGCNLK